MTFSVFFSLITLISAQAAEAPRGGQLARHPGWNFAIAGRIPVQNGGRLKPLDSFARELVLFETGSRSFDGWEPLDLVFSWIALPHEWRERPFIQVTREDVKRQLGIDEKRNRFSPRELFENSALSQYASRMSTPGQMAEPPNVAQGMARQNPREQELKQVMSRLALFHQIISGDAWLVIPRPAPEAWLSLAAAGGSAGSDSIRSRFGDLIRSYVGDDSSRFEKAAVGAREAVESQVIGWNSSMAHTLQAEALYNRIRPFLWSWILYLVAALTFFVSTSGVPSLKFRNRAKSAALALAGAGFLVHSMGIAIRCYVAGRPPVTNMYESIMWVSLGVMVFAGILFWIQRHVTVLAVACALATFGLIAGDAAPAMMDPGMNPLVPVLRSNYWLTIHVLTITLGYAALALTLGLGNVTLFHFWKGRERSIAPLNQLTYRAMQFGVVLLAAGTILGGIWADYSWGRFWGWDPKEVWALIALLCYLTILHGRYTRWMGPFGFAAWSVVAFLSVIMAWYGVNFVLGVGLHSYGFSTGGRGWVAGFVGSQLLYVLAVAGMRKRMAQKKAHSRGVE